MNMIFPEIYTATGMMELIQKIGFFPLLDNGIEGFSAEDIAAEDCRYVTFPEGGWDQPLWKWKSEIVQEMPCMYEMFRGHFPGSGEIVHGQTPLLTKIFLILIYD